MYSTTCVTDMCPRVYVLLSGVEYFVRNLHSLLTVCPWKRYCRRGNRRMDTITIITIFSLSMFHSNSHSSQGLYNLPPKFGLSLFLMQILWKIGQCSLPSGTMAQPLGIMPHEPLCSLTVGHPPDLHVQAFFRSQIQLRTMNVCQQGDVGTSPRSHLKWGISYSSPSLLSRTGTKIVTTFFISQLTIADSMNKTRKWCKQPLNVLYLWDNASDYPEYHLKSNVIQGSHADPSPALLYGHAPFPTTHIFDNPLTPFVQCVERRRQNIRSKIK